MANNEIPTVDTTFFERIEGWLNGEPINQEVMNRPITQLAGNAGWLRKKILEILAALQGKEPTIVKNTAFNKNFGTEAGTVAEGNDPRLYNSRTPLPHSHNILDLFYTYSGKGFLSVGPQGLAFVPKINWTDIENPPTYFPTSMESIQGLTESLAAKANTIHTHSIDNITGLRLALDTLTIAQQTVAPHTHQAADIIGLKASDIQGLEDVIGSGTKTSIKRQSFTSAGESSFLMSNQGTVFKITMNGIDLEQSEWVQTGSAIAITTKVGDVLIFYVEVTTKADQISRSEFTAIEGAIAFEIAEGISAWQVTVNGVDLENFTQTGTTVTTSQLNGGDIVVIYGIKV